MNLSVYQIFIMTHLTGLLYVRQKLKTLQLSPAMQLFQNIL